MGTGGRCRLGDLLGRKINELQLARSFQKAAEFTECCNQSPQVFGTWTYQRHLLLLSISLPVCQKTWGPAQKEDRYFRIGPFNPMVVKGPRIGPPNPNWDKSGMLGGQSCSSWPSLSGSPPFAMKFEVSLRGSSGRPRPVLAGPFSEDDKVPRILQLLFP